MADTETASKRPFWVTLVAAIATVIVVLALAAGPTLSGCATSAEGFNSCVRGKLADIGLLPRSPLPINAPATQSDDAEMTVADADTADAGDMAEPQAQSVREAPAEPESETSTTEAEPASSMDSDTPATEADMQVANVDDTSAAETEQQDQSAPVVADEAPRPPLLGLVRVEPDGSLVVAGSAEPNAEIEIYANGELLGRTTAESSGDWVFVPDQPLPPGAAEITVTAPALGLTADRSVVVVVQEDRTTEPLVVASQPGEASEVLQGVSETEEEAPMEVADATTGADAVPMDAPAEEPATDPEAASEPEVVSEPEAAPAPEADMQDTEMPATEMADDTAGEDMAVAAVDTSSEPAEMETSEPMATVVPPSIDAIEIDGDKNFFAGSGEEGATIRLYINDGFIADSVVSDGRWLIETARNVLTDVSQRVRVDMLDPGSADVIGRAEVNFEIVLPEVPAEDGTDTTTVVADNASDAAPEPMADATADMADESAQTAESEPVEAPESAPQSEPETTAEAPEPATDAEEQPMVVADTSPEAEPATEMQAEEATEAEQMPAMESEEPAETQVAAAENAVVDNADEDVPTITAVQIGEDDQRFAAGRAIIRRGDNLWTIARRVYGEGVRYTTIYQANREQIRNPDLIYPGQVFSLPGEGE